MKNIYGVFVMIGKSWSLVGSSYDGMEARKIKSDFDAKNPNTLTRFVVATVDRGKNE
jgi:hypothetical protein